MINFSQPKKIWIRSNFFKVMDAEIAYNKWRTEFRKLDCEMDDHREYFLQNKKCRCTSVECAHYKNMRNQIFGNRISELYDMRLKIGLSVFTEAMNQN